jgi:hypothetical protein
VVSPILNDPVRKASTDNYTTYVMPTTLMTLMEENRTHVRLTNELLMNSVPELNTSNH